jgi:hypothetical protein
MLQMETLKSAAWATMWYDFCHGVKGEHMNDIETRYALFNLTEDNRRRLMQLLQLAAPPDPSEHRIVVETVIVHDGARTVIEREERSA